MSQEEKFKEFTDKLVNIKTELMKDRKKIKISLRNVSRGSYKSNRK